MSTNGKRRQEEERRQHIHFNKSRVEEGVRKILCLTDRQSAKTGRLPTPHK
jgi:hypothetical protein